MSGLQDSLGCHLNEACLNFHISSETTEKNCRKNSINISKNKKLYKSTKNGIPLWLFFQKKEPARHEQMTT